MPKSYTFTGPREIIRNLGKENLAEMLHTLTSGIVAASAECTVRIYLEDLTKGVLSCAHATGANQAALRETYFPIIATDALVSNVFVSQQIYEIRSNDRLKGIDRELADKFSIDSSTLFPLISNAKSLGVICCDSNKFGEIFNGSVKFAIAELLADIADQIDQARKY